MSRRGSGREEKVKKKKEQVKDEEKERWKRQEKG